MGLKAKASPLFLWTTLWILLLIGLALWWIYLLTSMADKLELLYQIRPDLIDGPNLATLAKWEGTTFLLLLSFISSAFVILYFKDKNKNKSMQAFLASLTHELKTPLASMRLQAEVIDENLKDNQFDKLPTLTERIIEDASKLEHELDKILQLSKIELKGPLPLRPVGLKSIIQKAAQLYQKEIEYITNISEEIILADGFAVETIFKNLFENTLKHAASSTDKVKVSIEIKTTGLYYQLTYKDNGPNFSGDIKQLGELFYKHNSPTGSGIGLYLCKNLTKTMNGKFEIQLNQKNQLEFTLFFNRGEK